MTSPNTASRPVAVVTGGATGIGAAIVRRLVRDGFSVAFTYRKTAAPVDSLINSLRRDGGRVLAARCDVRLRDSVDALAEQVRAAFGAPQAIVNNAAIGPHTPFLSISEQEWGEVLNTNLGGCYRVTQAFLPALLERGDGVIVNLASELAFLGESEMAHYVASKSALIGLTKSLAREFGPRGIRVNAVAPGPTDTRLLTEGERTPEYISRLPLRRLGRPDEIAETVAFLCSDAAAWYAGQVVSPNGGAAMP